MTDYILLLHDGHLLPGLSAGKATADPVPHLTTQSISLGVLNWKEIAGPGRSEGLHPPLPLMPVQKESGWEKVPTSFPGSGTTPVQPSLPVAECHCHTGWTGTEPDSHVVTR